MRKDLAGKISDSELEVMKLLWHAEASLSITEIREKLQQTKGWEPATIKTLVSRLVSKGAVRQEKRRGKSAGGGSCRAGESAELRRFPERGSAAAGTEL